MLVLLQSLVKVKAEKEVPCAFTKVKAEKEVKQQRKKAQLKDLPDGTKNFSHNIILIFICHVHSGHVPWPLDERDIAPALQKAWDEVYRRKVPFHIMKGSVPYELVLFFLASVRYTTHIIQAVQKLSDLRTKFGVHQEIGLEKVRLDKVLKYRKYP